MAVTKAKTWVRYTGQQKEQAVRLVRQAREEQGNDYGVVSRIAGQLGIGVESVRSWTKQADVDEGVKPGVTTTESARVRELERENRELRRANAILKSASAFFAAEFDRPSR